MSVCDECECFDVDFAVQFNALCAPITTVHFPISFMLTSIRFPSLGCILIDFFFAVFC